MLSNFTCVPDNFRARSTLPRAIERARGRGAELVRRLLEMLLAFVLIFLISPLLLAIMVAVRASGPTVIFAHRRAGRHGMPFPCYKFRTMVPDAGAALEAHLVANPPAAREWSETRKLKNDPRITPLGRWLRQSSVDELPQLFNILLGHMSFVGPRPITFDEFRFYGGTARDYLSVKPGLTGLWQTSGRSELSYAERVAFDRAYARNRSIFLDVLILFKTVPALLRHKQAV